MRVVATNVYVTGFICEIHFVTTIDLINISVTSVYVTDVDVKNGHVKNSCMTCDFFFGITDVYMTDIDMMHEHWVMSAQQMSRLQSNV